MLKGVKGIFKGEGFIQEAFRVVIELLSPQKTKK
jgi:hypothetical protein